jgi:hypothetical protein
MSERKINLKIDAMGNVVVEAEGFNGAGCEAATKPIEQALAGGAGIERTYKDEWNRVDTDQEIHDHVTF